MGHVIQYAIMDKNGNKDALIADICYEVEHEDWQEGGTYNPRQLTWHDGKIYDTKEEAHQAIEQFDNGWYDDHAVLFRDTDTVTKKTKKIETLESRIAAEQDKKAAYISDHQITNRKSAFMTCPKCNSKIALAYYTGTHFCPVCGGDLYSNTVVMRLDKFDTKIKELKKELKKEEREQAKKNAAKAPIKWLVKYEYHV